MKKRNMNEETDDPMTILSKAIELAREQIKENCPADGKKCETKQCEKCPQFPARALLSLREKTLLKSTRYSNFPEDNADCLVLLDNGAIYEAKYEYSRTWRGKEKEFLENEGEPTHWILKKDIHDYMIEADSSEKENG